MKAAIYTRFSSDRQSEMSTQAQVRACKEYADANGIEIVRIYSDEAISGTEEKTENRLQYQTMLEDLPKHLFEIILIHKHDRIARSLEEHVRLSGILKKEKVLLIAVAQNFGDGLEGDFAKQMTWVLSEYYSKNLSKEVKKGHREVALRGLHNGGCAPFGYDIVDQHYIINEVEAVYVRKMFDAALNHQGYNDLIQEMADAGIVGKRGKPIGRTQIHEILCNEKYTGTYLYCLEEEPNRADRRTKPHAIRVENAIPAIVDKNTFFKVQQIMINRKQSGKRSNYLCRSLVHCSCGRVMHVSLSARNGRGHHYYRCPARCGARGIRVEEVDEVATQYLHDLLSRDHQDKLAEYINGYKLHKKSQLESFYAAINRSIKEKQAEYDALMNNLSSSVLPPSVVSNIGNKMQALLDEIHALETTEPPEDRSLDVVAEWLNEIKAAPDSKIIPLLIDRIDVIQLENRTDFSITSTLKSALSRNMVAGEGFEPTTSGL